jgi:hypothetical protein
MGTDLYAGLAGAFIGSCFALLGWYVWQMWMEDED